VLSCSDGTYKTVVQKQGSAQGCGLAGLIAAFSLKVLVLDFLKGSNSISISPPSQGLIDNITHYVSDLSGEPILIRETASSCTQSDSTLCARNALISITRQHTDFVRTGGAPILSFMDDMSSAASYAYLVAFIRFLLRKGPRAGVYLNLRKTQILLGRAWDRDWRDTDESGIIDTRLNIIATFVKLGVPLSNIITAPSDGPTSLAKINGGIKLLGTAIGFRTFVRAFRQKALLKQKLAFQAISKYTEDKLHCYLLVRFCVLPMLNHLFCIPGHLDDALIFANLCENQLQRFFRDMFNGGAPLDSETKNSFELAKQLVRHGGISFTSPLKFFSACQIASWSRVLAQAPPASSSPILAQSVISTINIHPSTKDLISSQLDTPSLPCVKEFFMTYNALSSEHPEEFNTLSNGRGVFGIIDQGMKPKLQSTLVDISSARDTVKIYNQLVTEEFLTGNQCQLLLIFRSVTSEMGSLFIDNLDMRNRLSSESFFVAIKRKLGIPLIPVIGIGKLSLCNLCNKMLVSRHADHAFSCFALKAQCSKYMHDEVRNALAALLSEYKKVAHSSKTALASVSIEQPGLVDGTLQRPADVSASFVNTQEALSPVNGVSCTVKAVAIDISFVANIIPQPPITSLDALNGDDIHNSCRSQHLIAREGEKRASAKVGTEGTANYLLGKSYAFVPFILDPFGGIGPHGSQLLYGAPLTRPRNTIDVPPIVTSQDVTQAMWVTPELTNSTVTSDFSPPFHPLGFDNLFREMSILGNKDPITDDPFPGDPSGSAARRHRMSLSLAVVGGAAFITRLYLASPLAAGDKAHHFKPFDDGPSFLKEIEKLSEAKPGLKPLSVDPLEESEGFDYNNDPPSPEIIDLLQTQIPSCDVKLRRPSSPDTDPDIIAVWPGPAPVYMSDSRLRNAGILILTPTSAVTAALALRQLLAFEELSENDLRRVLRSHNINYPKKISDPRRMVGKIIKILELCFRAVAMLPCTTAVSLPECNLIAPPF
jgi:hypothetical protein